MDKIFVDTAAWIALMNTRDQLHQPAQVLMDGFDEQNTQLLTTEFVLLEVADALCRLGIREHTVAYINNLRQFDILQILPATSELFAGGWALYSQRPDKE